MKKIRVILICVLVLALLTGNAFAFSNNQIEVNGEVHNLNKALIENEINIFVSVRELAGVLGYLVEWNAEERAVSLKKDTNEYLLWPNSDVVKTDLYTEVKLSSKTFIQNATLYIPLNAAVDVFGLKLEKSEEYYKLHNGSNISVGTGYSVDSLYEMAIENSEALRIAEENVERYEITEENAKESLGNTSPSSEGGSPAEAARLAAYQNYYGQGIGLEMTKKTVDTTKEKIRHDLLSAIETILVESDSLILANGSLEVHKITYDQSKLKFELGLISSLDLDAVRINYENADKSLTMQLLALENAWINLNEMIGMVSTARVNFDYNLTISPMENIDLEKHISDVLAYSPTIWNLEQQIELAENSVKFYVFNTGGTPYEAEEIDVTLAKINLISAKDSMEESLRTTFNSISTLKENDALLGLKVAEAINNINLAKQNFEVGLTTEIQVKSAELAYKQAINSKYKNIASYLQAVRLYEKPWIAQ